MKLLTFMNTNNDINNNDLLNKLALVHRRSKSPSRNVSKIKTFIQTKKMEKYITFWRYK